MAEYQITAVHVANPGTHESHITQVRIHNGARNFTVQEIVNAIDNRDRFFFTTGGNHKAWVETARSSAGHRYIRTVADSTRADNLLYLPRF